MRLGVMDDQVSSKVKKRRKQVFDGKELKSADAGVSLSNLKRGLK